MGVLNEAQNRVDRLRAAGLGAEARELFIEMKRRFRTAHDVHERYGWFVERADALLEARGSRQSMADAAVEYEEAIAAQDLLEK